MIINSIILDNIRSYFHEEVEFAQGISLFEGDIGSGKSTVLMAIEFALFGLGSQKAESLLAKKADRGSVLLDFSVDGKRYEIKRTLKRSDSSVIQDAKNSCIKASGETLPLSPSELKQKVLQILRFNEPASPKAESKIFRYAIFTPQETMKEVLSDANKRIETIRRAFKIEDYRVAESNTNEVISKINDRIEIFKERSSNISELESEIKKLNRSVADTRDELAQTEAKIASLRGSESEICDKVKRLQSKDKERIELESDKENLSKNIESAKTSVEENKQECTDLESELEQNNAKLRELQLIRKPDTQKTISDINDEIDRVQKISDEDIRLNAEKTSIHKDITSLKKDLGEKINSDEVSLQKDLSVLHNEKSDLEKLAGEIKQKQDKTGKEEHQKAASRDVLLQEVKKLSELGNVCPVCKQEITQEHHHTLVGDKQKNIVVLEEELKTIKDAQSELDSRSKKIQEKMELLGSQIVEIKAALSRIKEYVQKRTRLEEIEDELARIISQKSPEYGEDPRKFLSGLKEELGRYEDSRTQIKEIAQRIQKTQEKIEAGQGKIDKQRSQIIKDEAELASIKEQLATFGTLDEDIKAGETELKKIRDEITGFVSAAATKEEKLRNEQGAISDKDESLAKAREWESKHKKFKQFQLWLKSFFIPTISKIERQVLLSIFQSFNETYTRWYSMLVEDPTKESGINENFTPTVNQDGFEQEVSYLSGGEKTSIALAYRLTLNSLMRKETDTIRSNLLILDEPTDGFSKDQLGKIRDVLDELKSEQIILVSHEKELETYVDNIYHVSKDDGTSKITRTS